MTDSIFKEKLKEKCEEIGINPDELSSSMLSEIEDQIYNENQ